MVAQPPLTTDVMMRADRWRDVSRHLEATTSSPTPTLWRWRQVWKSHSGGGGRVNQPKAPEGWGFPQGESQPPSPLPVSAGLCPALPMWPGAWRDPPDKPNLTVGARGRQGASGLRRGGPRTPGHQGWKRFGHLGSQGWPCFSHLPGRKGRQQGQQVPWLDGPVSTTPGSQRPATAQPPARPRLGAPIRAGLLDSADFQAAHIFPTTGPA